MVFWINIFFIRFPRLTPFPKNSLQTGPTMQPVAHSLLSPVQSEMQVLVGELLVENSRYRRELRSFHRDAFVTPIVITYCDAPNEHLHCVSRNVSPAGISLISSFDARVNMTATLELYRVYDEAPTLVMAECRWSLPFGPKYWTSGWQFIRVLRK